MRNQMLATNPKHSASIGKTVFGCLLTATITGYLWGELPSADAQGTPVPAGRSILGTPYPRANVGSRTDQPIILSEFAIPQATTPKRGQQLVDAEGPASGSSNAGQAHATKPAYVWLKLKGEWASQVLLRKVVKIDGPISGTIQVSGHDPFQVFCNGRVVGEGDSQSSVQTIDVSTHLRHGDNVIAVQSKRETADTPGIGLRFWYNTSLSRQTVETDSTWLAAKRALPLWKTHLYSDRSWTEAAVVQSLPTAPSDLPTNSGLPIPTTLPAMAIAGRTTGVATKPAVNKEQNDKLTVVSGKQAPAVPNSAVAMNLADRPESPTEASQTKLASNAVKQVPSIENAPTDAQLAEKIQERIYPATQATALATDSAAEAVIDAGMSPEAKLAAAVASETQAAIETKVPAALAGALSESGESTTTELSTGIAAAKIDSATKDDQGISPTQVSSDETTDNPVATVGFNASAVAERFDDSIKLRVPEGFIVEPIASSEIGSLIAIEFDEFGRLLASKEQGGLVRIDLTVPVTDPKRVTEICSDVSAVQGILPLNGALFVTGQGPDGLGLYRLDDSDGDFKYETVNKVCGFTGEPGEHGPHAVNLGSDRMLYVLLGNHSQIEGEYSEGSLINHFYEGDLLPRYEDPSGHAAGIQSPGGTLIRMSLDGSQKEVVAAGIRNAYDFAFSETGEIFFHDSDMESDEGTSWYRPTALHHLIGGGDYGWRSGWAKWRSYYPDAIAPIAVTGRSSPSGCAYYQHVRFPAEYQNKMFLADWSNGRIVSVDLEPNGATYKAKLSTFMEGRPLNVTDLSVGPEDGALYVALGGRASTGGVYRVRWTGAVSKEQTTYGNDWEEVVRSPLFYSAASRQRIATLKQKLSASWDRTIRSIITSEKNVDAYRIRALDILQWFGPTPDIALLEQLKSTESIAVRAKVATILGTLPSSEATPVLTDMMLDSSPLVQRCVCESLSRLNAQVSVQQIIALMDSPDRTVAYVAGRLLEKQPVDQWRKYLSVSQTPDRFVHLAVTTMTVEPSLANAYAVLVGVTKQLDQSLTDNQKLDLIRVTQLALARGNVEPAKVPVFVERLTQEFPSQNSLINRELIYALTYLKAAGISDRYSAYLKDDSIEYVDRWHMAMHLQTMGDVIPSELRNEMLHFLEASRTRDAGGSYAHYVMQATRNLASHVSDQEAGMWVAKAKDCPSTALIALGKISRPLGLDMTIQIGQLEQALSTQHDPATQDLQVGVVAVLGETLTDGEPEVQAEAAKILELIWERDPNRRQWVALAMSQCPLETVAVQQPLETNAALRLASQARTTLLPVESKPVYANRFQSYLVRSLPYLSGSTASDVLACLQKVTPESKNPEHLRNIILIGLRYPEAAAASHQILSSWAGQVVHNEAKPQAKMLAWQSWFAQRYPQELPAVIPSSDDAGKWTVAEIEKQLSLLQANVTNGQSIYQEARCASCHKAGSMGSSVGPDLNLVTGRFTRREIIESIVHPSQVISDQYRSDLIQTEDGKMLTGIVSQLPGGRVAVLDSEGKRTVLNKIDIVEVKRSTESIMPSRLLETLNAQQVVDLIGFLESEDRPQIATNANAESVR